MKKTSSNAKEKKIFKYRNSLMNLSSSSLTSTSCSKVRDKSGKYIFIGYDLNSKAASYTIQTMEIS